MALSLRFFADDVKVYLEMCRTRLISLLPWMANSACQSTSVIYC